MATLWNHLVTKCQRSVCASSAWEFYKLSLPEQWPSGCLAEVFQCVAAAYFVALSLLRVAARRCCAAAEIDRGDARTRDALWHQVRMHRAVRLPRLLITAALAVLLAQLSVLCAAGQAWIRPPSFYILSVMFKAGAWALALHLTHANAMSVDSSVPLLAPTWYLMNALATGVQLEALLQFVVANHVAASHLRWSWPQQVDAATTAVTCLISLALFVASFALPTHVALLQQERIVPPEETASVWSRATFSWMNPLFRLGHARPLQPLDVPPMSRPLRADVYVSALQTSLRRHRNRIVHSLHAVHWAEFWSAAALKLVEDVSVFAGPLLLQRVVESVGRIAQGASPLDGFLYAGAIFLFTISSTLASQQGNFIVQKLYICATGALSGVLYRKALRLSHQARHQYTQGRIMTLVSNDAEKAAFYTHFFDIWDALLKVTISISFLVFEVGYVATLAGLAVICLMIPMNGLMVRRLQRLRESLLHCTDRRVQLMSETLGAIKVIKVSAWENEFRKRMAGVRTAELEHARAYMYFNFGNLFLFSVNPVLASVACFTTYAVMGNALSVSRAFAALALFNNTRVPLNYLPIAIGDWLQARVATRRLEEFLNQPELRGRAQFATRHAVGVQFEACDFAWADAEVHGRGGDAGDRRAISDAERTPLLAASRHAHDGDGLAGPMSATDTFMLRDITLQVGAGALIAVIGPVGAGKSSLLSAVLGEMHLLRGAAHLRGSIAYCAQAAFIVNASVRDNVLFGRPYHAALYRRAVRAACLVADLKTLPAGDHTMIGMKGVTLSGGQKQRISVARAVYADADLYVLDDVLSAVDAHVASTMWDECITGALRRKARLISMNQINLLPGVDYIVFVDGGRILWRGTPDQFAESKLELARFLLSDGISDDEAASEALGSLLSSSHAEESLHEDEDSHDLHADAHGSAAQQDEEETDTGHIPFSVLRSYIAAYGSACFIFGIVAGFALDVATAIGTDWWMGFWFSGKLQPPPGLPFFLSIYFGWALANSSVVFGRNLAVAVGGLRSARDLHLKLFSAVLRAPQRFFDVTPVGRVLNRFSKDQEVIDTFLPFSFSEYAKSTFQLLGVCTLIAINTPAMVPLMLLLAAVYYPVQRYYRATFRELIRIEATGRSLVFNHIAETLDGVETVRAYADEARFDALLHQRLDRRFQALFALGTAEKWLEVRLNFLGTCLVTLAAAFSVYDAPRMDVALVGLSLAYALSVTGILTWNVRQFAAVEGQLISVQRQLQYIGLEAEAPPVVPHCRPPSGWPQHGGIELQEVVARYRPDLPPVLRGVSCVIRPKEKVGIVGRTGAGKSTLFTVLLRLIEPSGGRILIDGLDVGAMGLHDLRSRLAIIPQDPVLFQGSVRSNLDPFGAHTDAELWTALRRVQLDETVQRTGGLEASVAAHGGNFSAGQRQLLCVARALLRPTSILLMDEATATVDFKTDAMIQRMLRDEFAGLTVLSIAHRLEDVIHYDRVMVFDDGRIAELDTPQNLLADRQSIFTALVEGTGEAGARHLKKMAHTR
ncbi:hypothetical protein CDCA_CDCA07G2191 [Cyanidium caldarium]|uniref:Probable ATP-dependent transporter ycf16 n=1 Tax=Cyanidium caldarium TaxID=2771 RepID=A0AAV9IVH8_CYACA|nr:hypothetical protein CDCA_CDCA07G2191 [Cyanidium caldarium]